MKKHIANAIVSLFVFACILNAATNDFVFYQIPASGPLTKKFVTPGTSKLFGWGSSASTPVPITIGSGLSLNTSTNTLTSTSSGGTWGSITGTLSAQTDLQTALDAKLATATAATTYAPINDPTFTGTVTMPSLGLVFPDGGGVIGMEFGGGLNKITLKTASLSGVKTVTIPSTTGTIVTTGDTGTVTNTMLAGSIDLTTKVTGTLPVANGGTGATTLGDAGVLIGNGTGAVNVTSAGTAGQVLTSNGAGVDPTFQAATGSSPVPYQVAKTDTYSTTSTTWVEVTGLDDFQVTTTGAGSKVLITAVLFTAQSSSAETVTYRITRGGTVLAEGDSDGAGRTETHAAGFAMSANYNASSTVMQWLDSPGSAATHSYAVEIKVSGAITAYINKTGADSTNAAWVPRGVSTMSAIMFP